MTDVVVVTGASAGVGRACAVEFARNGASGGRAHIAVADVSDPAQVESAADANEAALGPIDIWGQQRHGHRLRPLEDLTPEEFARVPDVTYHGSVWGTRTALRRMRPRGRGTIVQIGSALAERGIPKQSASCGAKHATEGMLDALRAELLEEGSSINIATVHLPAINSPQFVWNRAKVDRHPQPGPPIFQPEVAARAVRDAVVGRVARCGSPGQR